MSYEPTDMRKLINLFEQGPTRNPQEEILEEALQSLINARYDIIALTTPELLAENWITDKVKTISGKIKAAIEAFKKDNSAPEARQLDDDLISYNDEVKSHFQAAPSGKMRVVFMSDSYEDIKRAYTTGLKAEDFNTIKSDTKPYPAAGNVELKYSGDFHLVLFQPGATFKKMQAYSGVAAARSKTSYKYAVVFNAPVKLWDADMTKMEDHLKLFKPAASNDNAVGILQFAKGGSSSYDKGILFPSLMTKEQLLKQYKDELDDAGANVNDVKTGNDVLQSASAAGTSDNGTTASNQNSQTTPVNNTSSGQPLALDIDDVKNTVDELKKIKKEIEDGTHIIDAKTLDNLEKIRTHLEELIAAAKAQQAGNVKKADFAKFEEALKKDLNEKKNQAEAIKLAKHLLQFANHWAKDGGQHTKIDIGKLKTGLDALISGKTTMDPDTRAIVNELANDFDTFDGTK